MAKPKGLRQFFEDNDGRDSMLRLLMFLSFFPASYVVIETKEPNIFGWYVSSYAAAYGAAKVSNAIGTLGKARNKPSRLGIE